VTTAQRSILTLLIGAALLLLGNGLLMTLLPIRARLEAFSPSLIGLMGTAHFLGFVIGCMIGPRVVAAVGHIRCFAGFAALTSVVILAYPMMVAPVSWVLLRGASGLCLAVLYLVMEAWLNQQSDNTVRGRVLSIYIIVTNVVTVGGQQMLNLYPAESQTLFSLTAMLIALALVPLSLTATAAPSAHRSAKLGVAALFRQSPSGFFGCLLVGVVEGSFWTLGPVFAEAKGYSVPQITLFMSAFVVGGTLSQWPIGRYSDTVDRRWVIIACGLGTACTGLAMTLLQGEGLWWILLLACLHGSVMIPLYALCLAHANDYAPNEALVEISSGLLLIYSVGAVLGPVIAGALMERTGPGALFGLMVALMALLVLFIGWRMSSRGRGDERLRAHYVPVPKYSVSVYEMEEEAEAEAEADTGSG
jgi:MFS family permease